LLREIRLFGDPVLRTPAEPVVDFDLELRNLVKDLTETMLDAPGVGLAAPQVGVSLRVFTYHVDDNEPGHLINPVLKLEGEPEEGDEGCLSLPGLFYPTPRAMHATAYGFDQHGEPLIVEGSGFLARALQHEAGHLDGQLYLDTLTGDTRRQALRELRAAPWARVR
jgi:peptide deformylase